MVKRTVKDNVTVKLSRLECAKIRGILYVYASQHPEQAQELKEIYDKLNTDSIRETLPYAV